MLHYITEPHGFHDVLGQPTQHVLLVYMGVLSAICTSWGILIKHDMFDLESLTGVFLQLSFEGAEFCVNYLRNGL
jgi:hypothetical protein